eukprot:scaffold6456_cov98-Isochrysis_galbana.AAC.5
MHLQPPPPLPSAAACSARPPLAAPPPHRMRRPAAAPPAEPQHLPAGDATGPCAARAQQPRASCRRRQVAPPRSAAGTAPP